MHIGTYNNNKLPQSLAVSIALLSSFCCLIHTPAEPIEDEEKSVDQIMIIPEM